MLISNKLIISVVGVFFLLNTNLYAQIITDGTLGQQSTPLKGPNFEINPELGKTMGSNLFHSFRDFNVGTGETATFTGPESVTNILARVTGANRSFIGGTLRSTIPYANLWLFNPNGILFGKDASLDISGSFHASTADGIKLGENEEGTFLANLPENSLLSAASPSEFGFLGGSSEASIEIHGNTIKNSNFSAPNGKINITTGNDALTITDSTLDVSGDKGAGQISIHANQLLATNAKIYANNNFGNVNGLIDISTPGNLSLSDNTSLDVSSVGGAGQIIISAGNFFADNSELVAGAYPRQSENSLGSISISTSGVNGVIGLRNTNINASGLDNGAAAGHVILNSKQFFANNSKITADNLGNKNGLVEISTQEEMSLTNGSVITANNQCDVEDTQEESGIVLKAGGSLFIGLTPEELCAVTDCDTPLSTNDAWLALANNFSKISSINTGHGIGGKIQISTPVLNLSYGMVQTILDNGIGNAGEIGINAKSILQDYSIIQSLVDSPSGRGGSIIIRGIDGIDSSAEMVSLSNWSYISASGIEGGDGDAGKIDLKTQHLQLNHHAEINSFNYGRGKAGSVGILASTILLTKESHITAHSYHTGGGNIDLQVSNYLAAFDDSIIDAQSWGNEEGNEGGHLTVSKIKVLVLEKSQLVASANAGVGGDINLDTRYIVVNFQQPSKYLGIEGREALVKLGYSVIDVTSDKSINGEIKIKGQRWEIPDTLALDRDFIKDNLSLNRCAYPDRSREQSYFIITARDILPRSPEDLRTHTIRVGK